MKVLFVSVGRNKRTWSAEKEVITAGWLYSQVKSNGQIMSSDVDFEDCSNQKETDGAWGNVIVGGFRTVGQYYVGKAITDYENKCATQPQTKADNSNTSQPSAA